MESEDIVEKDRSELKKRKEKQINSILIKIAINYKVDLELMEDLC